MPRTIAAAAGVVLVACVVACGGESRPPPRASPATEPVTCPTPTFSGASVLRSWGEVLPLENGGLALVLDGPHTELAGAEPLGLVGTRSVSCSDRTVWWVPGVECNLGHEGIDALARGATVLEVSCFQPQTRDMLREHCENGSFGPKACARIQEALRAK